MTLRYVFSELRQSLLRNLSMHLAVVLTLFVSLTLVGLGVLLNQQATKTEKYYGGQLEITLFLCKTQDSNPSCATEITDAQRQTLEATLRDNPEVRDFHTESKEVAYEQMKELIGPEKFEGKYPAATVEDMRESIWITLEDPKKYEGVVSAVQGLDGVSQVRDMRDTVKPVFVTIDKLQMGAIATAVFLVVAALLMVANTIRLAAFARRKEIGIMRLVGASTLYIALPFLLEALVTAVVGVTLAAGALAAFMEFGIQGGISESIKWIPWVGTQELGVAVLAIAVLGPVLTLLPTLFLTRKYLKV